MCFPRSGVIIYAISVAHIASLTLPFTECLSNVLHWRLFADDNPARIKPSGPCVVYANWDETDTVADYVLGAVACAIRQCLCVTVRGVVAKPAHGGEAVAPAADGDAEPDAAGPPIRILHHQLKKQMTSLPPLGASHPRRRRGQLHPFASFSNNVNKPLSSHRRNRTATAELDRLGALQMPGVRPESPAPELRRIRTANPAASSKVDSGRARMSVRAKVPVNLKAKGSEDQEKRITDRRGRLVPAERCRSPTPQPPPVGSEVGSRRCSWITANSEPLYVKFHDDEWGVPVHNDQKLFELLTLSQALAEHTWPTILSRREEFREMFDRFNFPSVSEFTDKKINLLRSSGSMLLSEQKIRAVVTNAKQMHKAVQEFGSFSIYCWSFVNHRPITNSFRYARQVPTKTPKAEAISKDLMRRGFQCVGPTTIYSFMQVSGIVNDHISCCFRFQACSNVKNVRAEPALSERRLSSPSSEDSDIRET